MHGLNRTASLARGRRLLLPDKILEDHRERPKSGFPTRVTRWAGQHRPGPLGAAAQNFFSAVDAHKAALDAEMQTYDLVQQERINWFDAYKLSHRTLCQMFYKEPKKADSYFKPVNGGKSKAKKPAPEGQAVGLGNEEWGTCVVGCEL